MTAFIVALVTLVSGLVLGFCVGNIYGESRGRMKAMLEMKRWEREQAGRNGRPDPDFTARQASFKRATTL